MLVLLIILSVTLKGIGFLNSKFVTYLADTESSKPKKANKSWNKKHLRDESFAFDYIYHSNKEILDLLTRSKEKSPKLVVVHQKTTAFVGNQVA